MGKIAIALILFSVLLLNINFASAQECDEINLDYEIDGGLVTEVCYNKIATSLFVNIDATDDGQITVTLPKSLVFSLDQECNSAGDIIILLNGEDVIPSSLTETNIARIVSLDFNKGQNTIEFIGTYTLGIPTPLAICGSIFGYETQYVPPKLQVKNNVSPQDVKCNEGLELILKATDNSPACVKPQTAEKLVEREWALAKSSLQSQNLRMRIVITSDDGCSIFELEKTPLSEWEKYELSSEEYYITLLDDEINQVPDLREMIDAMKNTSGFEPVSYDEGLLVKRISGVDHGEIFYWLFEEIAIKTPAGFEHSPAFRYNDDMYTFGLIVC